MQFEYEFNDCECEDREGTLILRCGNHIQERMAEEHLLDEARSHHLSMAEFAEKYDEVPW